ncbi:hypothetical protein ABZP36_029419 [Zizania latifolia]
MAMSIRKALGAVKDQTSIGIAKVSAAVAPELDVAIVRATSHDDAPADDRHVREVLNLSAHSRPYVAACVASLARRLSRTRDYVVAAKCLALLHRLVADGGPPFRHELLRPQGRRGAPLLALLADFRDEAHSASWDHSAFVRAYASYIDHHARFLLSILPAPRTVRFADDGGSSPAPVPVTTSVRDMDTEALLGRTSQLRQLLDRFLACRPSGAARHSRIVLSTLYPMVKESAQLCADVSVVLAVLMDRFFDMDYPDCVKVFEAYVSTAKQTDDLLAFYGWCDDVGVARPVDYAEVNRIDDKLLETLEQFLRERGRIGQGSPPPRQPAQYQPGPSDETADMNGIKALPAPEHHNAAPARPTPVAKKTPEQQAPTQTRDLVDLREPVGDDQDNKLALALFSGPPAANGTDGGWVTFPSDDAPEVTSAWQTPAAEAGKPDWELALVETTSNLSRQKAAMGGGLDPFLLHGMYDQGALRQQVGAQAATGSASSVAVPRQGAATAVLALPAPDGTVQTAGGDPFAASLSVPPPAYVQIAEMERKQQLLVQEQQMWAQYRQGGMQGQAAMDRFAAAGGGYMPTAMQFGNPMASYNGYY